MPPGNFYAAAGMDGRRSNGDRARIRYMTIATIASIRADMTSGVSSANTLGHAPKLSTERVLLMRRYSPPLP